MTLKVKIHLLPINVNQIMSNNTLEISKLDTKCQRLIVYIRKKIFQSKFRFQNAYTQV